jgi:tetratricopeptide (TPR) repeat protein
MQKCIRDYTGRDEIMPFDVAFPDWIERGSADAAMFIDFEDRYETAQEARREALIGFGYAEKGMPTNALACWAKAAKANPRDPLLMELAESLDKEARSHLAIGNVNGALRCYEHRLEVFPNDVAAIHNFGVCLKKAGHPELAARVFAKAVELDPLQDAHRLELIDSADAGGHPDIAVRQIDVLLKRNPDDLELKKRRARILVQMHFDEQRKKQANKPDHSPSRYLDEKQKGK